MLFRSDHFKQAAHLAYWLRRTAPIVKMNCPDLKGNFGNVDSAREIHFKYGNEYSAFTVGFDLCRFYEANKKGSNPDIYASDYSMNDDYITVMAHFLKTKNVSPHALYLIYKSLFFNPIKV